MLAFLQFFLSCSLTAVRVSVPSTYVDGATSIRIYEGRDTTILKLRTVDGKESRELATHLGYADIDSVSKIYERHQTFFIDGRDSVTFKLKSTDGKEYDTRCYSYTGCLGVCRYSDMPPADDVMQQLINLADKVRKGEYPANNDKNTSIVKIHNACIPDLSWRRSKWQISGSKN
jgi:hypothetical protein